MDYLDLLCCMEPGKRYGAEELSDLGNLDRVSITKLLNVAVREGLAKKDGKAWVRLNAADIETNTAPNNTSTEMIEAGDTTPDTPPAKPAPVQVPEKAPVQVKATPIALVKPKPAKTDKGDEAIKAIGLLKQSLDNAAKYQCAGHINEFERKVEILSKLGSLLDSSITEYLDEIAVDLARIHALGGGAQHESA